jgi:hypothetical protein
VTAANTVNGLCSGVADSRGGAEVGVVSGMMTGSEADEQEYAMLLRTAS